jgi:DnaJ-class molecular chaperone
MARINPPLRTDANGDKRLASEEKFPIKAQCVGCGGRGLWSNYAKQQAHKCRRCNGRGYYFLPLGT